DRIALGFAGLDRPLRGKDGWRKRRTAIALRTGSTAVVIARRDKSDLCADHRAPNRKNRRERDECSEFGAHLATPHLFQIGLAWGRKTYFSNAIASFRLGALARTPIEKYKWAFR